ncbi:MAG: hypothetical protein ACE5MK_08435, partial [Acidobacteriota bacterium]
KREGVPVVTMIVRNTQKVSLPPRPLGPRNSIIVFNEQVESIPKVVVTPYGAGLLIQVGLQIIKRLSEDPRVQKQFSGNHSIGQYNLLATGGLHEKQSKNLL